MTAASRVSRIARRLVLSATREERALVAENRKKLERRFVRQAREVARKTKCGFTSQRGWWFHIAGRREAIYITAIYPEDAIKKFCVENPGIPAEEVEELEFPVAAYATPVRLR